MILYLLRCCIGKHESNVPTSPACIEILMFWPGLSVVNYIVHWYILESQGLSVRQINYMYSGETMFSELFSNNVQPSRLMKVVWLIVMLWLFSTIYGRIYLSRGNFVSRIPTPYAPGPTASACPGHASGPLCGELIIIMFCSLTCCWG